MIIIFVSVLFHEYGHALTSLLFGRQPRIELVIWGGLTYHEGENLSYPKQFLITLNGPVFGFILFLIATAVLHFVPISNPNILAALKTMQWVNLFWTVLNLLPVMPLDGGQLLRIFCEGIWGVRGLRYALLASMSIAIIFSLVCFLYQQILVGAIFFLFAFQSFDTWRKNKLLSEQDRDTKLRDQLKLAESALHDGRKDEAKEKLIEILKRAKAGMIHLLASEYLAYLYYEEGDPKAAYDLLLPLSKQLSTDALCLLHKVAYECKDYTLVIDLGGRCFQTWPSVDTALRNAYAFAALAQAAPSLGWLQTALKEGLENVDEIIADPAFNPIRQDQSFQTFVSHVKQA